MGRLTRARRLIAVVESNETVIATFRIFSPPIYRLMESMNRLIINHPQLRAPTDGCVMAALPLPGGKKSRCEKFFQRYVRGLFPGQNCVRLKGNG